MKFWRLKLVRYLHQTLKLQDEKTFRYSINVFVPWVYFK